jgi:hypothetical protein
VSFLRSSARIICVFWARILDAVYGTLGDLNFVSALLRCNPMKDENADSMREDGMESSFEIGTWWVMWAKYRLASSCGVVFDLSQWSQEASEPQRTWNIRERFAEGYLQKQACYIVSFQNSCVPIAVTHKRFSGVTRLLGTTEAYSSPCTRPCFRCTDGHHYM